MRKRNSAWGTVVQRLKCAAGLAGRGLEEPHLERASELFQKEDAHMCTHTHTHVCTQAHTDKHTHTHRHAHTQARTHIHMHTRAHTHGKPEQTRLAGCGPSPSLSRGAPATGTGARCCRAGRGPGPARPSPSASPPAALSLCTSQVTAQTQTLHTSSSQGFTSDGAATPLSVQWHLWASESKSIPCCPGFLTCDKQSSFRGTTGCAWICCHRLRLAFLTLR